MAVRRRPTTAAEPAAGLAKEAGDRDGVLQQESEADPTTGRTTCQGGGLGLGGSCMSFRAVVGVDAADLCSWRRFVAMLYRPTDPASLAVIRILFGLLMAIDTLEERGLGEADLRWGAPKRCYFPLFDFLRPLPLAWMCIIYFVIWLGAVGMMLGYRFRLSCLLFAAPYWFVLLLDKSRWNNHSYLFGICALLLSRSSAHHYLSVDAWLNGWRDRPVPLWNYGALRLQFFLLYFLAGVKKLDADWIGGFPMRHLNNHWVFEPFKLVLSPEQVDYWIVHVTGFTLDLTIGFWMYLDATRPVAFIFCAMFHLMNSRLFMIGMFPYVCLATMPLFCHNDWPRRLCAALRGWWTPQEAGGGAHKTEERPSWAWLDPERHRELVADSGCLSPVDECRSASKKSRAADTAKPLRWYHHLTAVLLISHTGLQLFLPYSHFITKGYNTWTNGLYGYSWDMMIHSWDTILVVVKVVEKDTGREHFLDPDAWVVSDRWARHADMAKQYATCVERNLLAELGREREGRPRGATSPLSGLTSDKLAVHVDVWCSLNGRFQQRIFDPRVDLLRAPWSPFQSVPWVMPLLTQLSPMRRRIRELEAQVQARSNFSDALFVADFPGLHLENYISDQLEDVTLTVLSGRVVLELNPSLAGAPAAPHVRRANMTLEAGASAPVPSRAFHRVHTVSDTPACYMYAYTNLKRRREAEQDDKAEGRRRGRQTEARYNRKSLLGGLRARARTVKRAVTLVSSAFLNILYSVPMVHTVRVG
ncbi:vitamin K-dependent gamma-carboxylase isoform X2 [Frankliniella occidentalis]|uniref:Vitamin K-dependent gamma-carboxylase isoform X2 n=1 Tax=Frankliniella occidentalis TaxID=133901 RepID=A0A6J1RSB9_FRAOC|nr:vitamin K-dependent gamma-carboxylase isoform X2 [Frankliniella occidentalis]